MGVKDLWNILGPSCEKKSLWELEGLTIAIDLSSWIVDSQNVGDTSLMNMYLRNLFFRTSYLLLLGVKPIFILEGKAPTLKHDTMARRLQAAKPNQVPVKNKSGSRGRLNCLQKKCEELLLSLGVSCYKSEGEAEAHCSKLNELGMVDAVISQDSDCFLYGARTVLRNFTMSPAYTCDMYTMDSIRDKLGLGRHKLLALSLLCGCDYEVGVQGVGKQSAVKFLATVNDEDVLDRLRSWRTADPLNSQNCYTQLTQEEKLEHNIRKKALLDPSFPSEEVISEFLSTKHMVLPRFVWNKPSLSKFMVIADRMLAWEEDYVQGKFLPLVSRWHLVHGGADCGLTLLTLVKKRTVRGVASYELRWQHDSVGELTTVEPVSLIASVYPELLNMFVKSKEKPKKATRGRKKKDTQESELGSVEHLLEKMNISEEQPKSKQPIKKKSKQKEVKGLQKLDRFLKPVSVNTITDQDLTVNPLTFSHSTPVRNINSSKSRDYMSDDNEHHSPFCKNEKFYGKKSASLEDMSFFTNAPKSVPISMNSLSLLDSSVDSAVIDLSDIVNSIVSRSNCNPAVSIWTSKLK